MQLHIHRITKNVIYFLESEETFLQPLEGVLERVITNTPLDKEMTLTNCYNWLYNGVVFIKPIRLPGEDEDKLALLNLLNEKANLLHKVDKLVCEVRYPFSKTTTFQSEVYNQKLSDAKAFLLDRSRGNNTLLSDEAEILGIDIKTAALQIVRTKEEFDWVLRCSEKTRRLLNNKISKANSIEELKELSKHLTKRNFYLPFKL